MDVKYINPFVAAVKNIFDTMIDIPFMLGKPKLKKGSKPQYEISSIIGLSGDVTGCVVISFSKELALDMASSLLGDPMTEIDDDCRDALGEIANMIVGNAKTDFPEGNNSISVPSVIVGSYDVSYPSGVPIISIPCETDSGKMVIEIAMKIG